MKPLRERLKVAGWERSQASAARGAAKTEKSRLAQQEKRDKIATELKDQRLIPKNAVVSIPRKQIETEKLSFDDEHINNDRNHNVNETEAKTWISEAKISVNVWQGEFEKYYGDNGATFVELKSGKIRTAFSREEFDDKTKGILEVLKENEY